MALKLKLRKNAPGLRYFTAEHLSALAGSFMVDLPPGDEIVHIGQNPPADASKRWQELDETGAHVGSLKTYQNGEWL